MFSQPVRHVAETRIFARATHEGRQLLVYAMHLEADADLAMVLPVPVPRAPSEDAVQFVDLSSCPTFFDQLSACFPVPQSRSRGAYDGELSASLSLLVVHDVGDFEASFVPTAADFSRLDARFRLSPEVLASLPNYADWGFCVFKLRARDTPTQASPPRHAAPSVGLVARVRSLFGGPPTVPMQRAMVAPSGERAYHPMAFSFPRREQDRLFFPTVHVHDGQVLSEADFDHSLYCQVASDGAPADADGTWQRAPVDVGTKGGPITTAGPWLENGKALYRRELRGALRNVDVWTGG